MANAVLNKWIQYLVLILMVGCMLTSYMAYDISKDASSRTLDIPTAEQIAALVDVSVDTSNLSIEVPEIEVPEIDNEKLDDIFKSLFNDNITALEEQAIDDADDEVADKYDDEDDFMDALEDFLAENIADFDRVNDDYEADDYDDVDAEVIVLAMYEEDADDESDKKVIKLNEIIMFDNRLYRVVLTKTDNGKLQGNRVILKLLRENDLMKIILDNPKYQKGELTKWKETKSKVFTMIKCDNCGELISQQKYNKNKGLCNNCVKRIQ